MAETFLSFPSKRPLHPENHTLTSPKRPKNHSNPQPIPAGHASLRIICHASHIGGLIGKSGSTIKQLQLQTGSKIRVDDSLKPGSDHRVVLIVAPTTLSQRVRLGDVEEDVSALQVAALRVFEKVLEVSSESESEPESISLNVLIEENQAGFVIGKGGKIVEGLKRDSGSKIRVLIGDKFLPSFVSPPHEVVQMEGDLLAVKKALVGVCGRLQQLPQGEKLSNRESNHEESNSQSTIFDFRVDPPLQRAPLYVATTSSSPAIVTRPLSFEVDRHAHMDSKPNQQEVVFKILCSNDRAGAVIGKGGSVIRALQEEARAKISIGQSVANCDERLVTITSNEDVDSRHSPAQHAAILVFARFAEVAAEKELGTGPNEGSSVSARLLIQPSQAGCLLGKGGSVVSEMRKATGANIRILKGEDVPKCASEDDHVVEITGDFVKIRDALYEVTSRLRSNLFPSNMRSVPEIPTLDGSRYERVRELPTGVHHSSETFRTIDGLSSMRQRLDSPYDRERLDHSHLTASRISELDASYHGRVRDLPIGVHHISATSQPRDGLSTMRQGLDSVYNRQRLDHSPLAGSRISELALDSSRSGRVRDLPIGVHRSFVTPESVEGLSATRQGLDSLYNRPRLDHSPLARSRTSEVELDARYHGRIRELPIGVHPSSAFSENIDGPSIMRQSLNPVYNHQRLDHLPLAGSRTSEVALDASQYGRIRDSFATTQTTDELSTMRQGVESFYDDPRLDHSTLAGSRTSEVANGVNSRSFVNLGRGLGSTNGGPELGSTNRSTIVTNTRVEILVPDDAISSVYGENGRNLMRIRQVSGAIVEVHEPRPGTRDRTVSISGTPEETQAAQSLLHAFILTGSC